MQHQPQPKFARRILPVRAIRRYPIVELKRKQEMEKEDEVEGEEEVFKVQDIYLNLISRQSGYDEEDDSWEPYEYLITAQEFLQNFWNNDNGYEGSFNSE